MYIVDVKLKRKPPLLGNKKVIEPDLGQLVVYKPRATLSVYKQLIDLGRFNNLYLYMARGPMLQIQHFDQN